MKSIINLPDKSLLFTIHSFDNQQILKNNLYDFFALIGLSDNEIIQFTTILLEFVSNSTDVISLYSDGSILQWRCRVNEALVGKISYLFLYKIEQDYKDNNVEVLFQLKKNIQIDMQSSQLETIVESINTNVSSQMTLRLKQERQLSQQSKLASMGEMIGAIAHQWRQPLNELTIRIQKLKYNYQKDEINEAFIQEFISKNKKTIEFMSKTIDDFRNFFRIDKQKVKFNVKEAIEEVINMQSAQLKNHNIALSTEGEGFSLLGFKSELQQVIINIINNSKDAFSEHDSKDAKIIIKLYDNKIDIKDNAGGILEDVIGKVFEPYFTTKDQGKGTGLGMYMSKMIIEDNMNAKISIKNEDEGALVTLNFSEST